MPRDRQKPVLPADTATRSPENKAVIASFLGRVALFSSAVDAIYLAFFLAIDAQLLGWMNLVSISMYLSAYLLVQRRHLHWAVMLIWLEAFPHAAIGTVALGWDSGFHYLLLMFIPSVAMTASRRGLHVFLAALLFFLAGIDLAARMWGPMAPISDGNLAVLKWLNVTLFIVMFSAMASYYRNKITQAEQRLQVLATVDVLTGLHNRRHFESAAQRHLARGRRTGAASAIVLGDVDFFKQINDTYGHDGGDLVLVAVARWLKLELREVDLLARWGGEEFVLLLHETRRDDAVEVTERIRRSIESSHVTHHATEIRCTMSFGVTELRPDDTLDGAIARADRALYRSKAEGRNRVSSD